MKHYNIAELKEIYNNYNYIDFFFLPTKLSKDLYYKHFPEYYKSFFIKDLSLTNMRRYYKDNVYKFYIDNIDVITNNPKIFIEYIKTLDTNTKKSLNANTIKSVYPLVLNEFNAYINPNLENEFKNNIDYYMKSETTGSVFNNRNEIRKLIIEYFKDNENFINDYNRNIKLSLLIRKYYFKEKIIYFCSTCNHVIKPSTKEFCECKSCYLKYKKERCSNIRENSILNKIPEHITLIDGNFYSDDFYNEEFTIKCSKCNKTHKFIFKSKVRILKCPKCDEKYTITHRINEEFNGIFKLNNRIIIKPLEIDLVNEDLKLGIEYNGLMFHSTGYSQFSKFNKKIENDYHLNKTNLCESKGYELLHIFENEFLDKTKKNIWLSIIKNKLNLNKKINLINYIIRKVEKIKAKEFLENNHLEGFINSKEYLGLYVENELKSIICLNKNEILRICNKVDNNINSEEVFVNYLKEKNKSLIIRLNRRFENSKECINLGFRILEDTEPRCFYFRENENILYTDIIDGRAIYDCGERILIKDTL